MSDEAAPLNREVLARVEQLLGMPIVGCRAVAGGYTPAARAICQTATMRFFVKVGTTAYTSAALRREMRVYRCVHGAFLPGLVAWDDVAVAPILVLEDLSGCAWPPPWSDQRVEQVLATLDVLHRTPVTIETFAEVHGDGGAGWHSVAVDSGAFLALGMVSRAWLDAALPVLLQGAALCRTDGGCLTHWDVRSDNMCLRGDSAVLVDWNLACLSNPELDVGFWLPSLAAEGGPLPERVLPHAPEVAAWVAGFFAARAGLPLLPDAPRVRWVQRQQLATALPWAVRALGLPPLDLV